MSFSEPNKDLDDAYKQAGEQGQNDAFTEQQALSEPALEIICDFCGTTYAVSVREFAHSYSKTFTCTECHQEWTEYLDDDAYEQVQQVLVQLSSEASVKESSTSHEFSDTTLSQTNGSAEHLAVEPDTPSEQASETDHAMTDQTTDESELDEAELAGSTTDDLADGANTEDHAADGVEDQGEAAGLEGMDAQNAEEGADDTTDQAANDAQLSAPVEPRNRRKKKKNTEIDAPAAPKAWYVRYLNPVAWGNFSLVPLVTGSVLVTSVFIVSFLYAFLFRYDIIHDNPVAIGAYQMAGINISPVEGLSVNIDDITREAIIIPGEQTRYDFEIFATVRNVGFEERRLPFLRVYLLDDLGDTIDFWDIDMTSRVLSVNDEVVITTQLPSEYSGNEEIESIEMRLLSEQERDILGINEGIQTQAIAS